MTGGGRRGRGRGGGRGGGSGNGNGGQAAPGQQNPVDFWLYASANFDMTGRSVQLLPQGTVVPV
jgi:hypothetical protein